MGGQTFSDGKKIYSVDINIFKPPTSKYEIKHLTKTLEWKGSGYPEKKIYYSALDVLSSPNNKKYKEDIRRIKNADFSYPVILYGENIVDGVQ